jgi:diacylglycerol kinase
MKIKRLKSSFGYAIDGIGEMLGDQQNFQIQVFIGLLIIVFALVLKLDVIRFSILLFVIAQVLSLEMANCALEKYIDHVSPEEHQTVGLVKDLLAAAVLVSAIIASIIGILIFYQPLVNFLS